MEVSSSAAISPGNATHLCQFILFVDLGNTKVRAWDFLILIPNLAFLIFLTFRFNRARLKLRATSSPIFITFYALVVLNVLVGLSRCFAAIAIRATDTSLDATEKLLWVVVKFFLIATEMSVVIFCLAFGHLDTRSSTRYVLLATSILSFAFSITQGVLETSMAEPTASAVVALFPTAGHVFHHGGIIFWMVSSAVFTTLYLAVLILPWTRLRDRLVLPTNQSFYVYVSVLMTVNLLETVGTALVNFGGLIDGLCLLDVTSVLYFTLYTPLVYYCFLAEFFSVSQPSILFSYKAQVDDFHDEDNVSLPHQQSFSSLKTDSDYIYQGNGAYDSTQFERQNNALYVASLQSPDSLPDSSLASTASLHLQ